MRVGRHYLCSRSASTDREHEKCVFTVEPKRGAVAADREVSDGGRSLHGQQLVEFQMGDQLSSISLKTSRSQTDVVVVKPAHDTDVEYVYVSFAALSFFNENASHASASPDCGSRGVTAAASRWRRRLVWSA